MAAPASDPSATAASASTPPVTGDPVQAENLANELSHDLMSPYCPGRTIATCPSPQARKLEAHILERAMDGKTRPEIEAELAARFPDIRGYVGRPEILYGTALVALLAILALIFVGRRWVGRSRVTAPVPGDFGPDVHAVPAAARLAPAGAPASSSSEVSALSAQTPAGAPDRPSRREIDALDDALDRIDEF